MATSPVQSGRVTTPPVNTNITPAPEPPATSSPHSGTLEAPAGLSPRRSTSSQSFATASEASLASTHSSAPGSGSQRIRAPLPEPAGGLARAHSASGLPRSQSHLEMSRTHSHLGVHRTHSHMGVHRTPSNLGFSRGPSNLGPGGVPSNLSQSSLTLSAIDRARNLSEAGSHHSSLDIPDIESALIHSDSLMGDPSIGDLEALNQHLELMQPAPDRSWRAVGTALLGGLRNVASAALNEASVTLGMAALPHIPTRLMGALAGHSIHQTIAVGIPTFAREMIGAGVMHLMRSQPQSVAVGMQAGMGAANLAMQLMREVRELRNPDAAARGYFSLSAEQWATKTPEEQATMRLHHRRMSRAFTVMQVGSSAVNLAMMINNFSGLDPTRPGFAGSNHVAALQPLSNEIKIGVYTAMRDAIQASFSMVGFRPGPNAQPGHEFAAGASGTSQAASASAYAGVSVVASYLGSRLNEALVPEKGSAIATLMGSTESGMTQAQAWKEVAAAAGVSSLVNTLNETFDWANRTENFVNQTGATQHWEPRLTGTDYGRVLDQSQSRAAFFNGVSSALSLAGSEMAESRLPPAAQELIGNAGLGAMFILLDSPITGLWQAEAEVRDATRTPAAGAPAGGVTITELEEGGADSSDRTSDDNSSRHTASSQLSAGNPPERHRPTAGSAN